MVAEAAPYWIQESVEDLEADPSLTRQVEEWALACRTTDIVTGKVKPQDRFQQVVWAVGRMVGRKPFQPVIAEVLGDTGDSALDTAYRIAVGEIPAEPDVLQAIYPGQEQLFEKAVVIRKNHFSEAR